MATRLRRVPEHRAVVPDSYQPLPEDRYESTTTQRCLLCGRRVFYGWVDRWGHVQDLSVRAFRRQKWRLVTRHGNRMHYEIEPGKTACGIHQQRRVEVPKPTRDRSDEDEFAWSFSHCAKCEAKLVPITSDDA